MPTNLVTLHPDEDDALFVSDPAHPAWFPVDVIRDLADGLRVAVHNIDERAKDPVATAAADESWLTRTAIARGWTGHQQAKVAELMRARPLGRIYRLKGGTHSRETGVPPIGVIVSYRPGAGGGPPEAAFVLLGKRGDDTGSPAVPVAVPAEALEDVTTAAQAGTLPELRQTPPPGSVAFIGVRKKPTPPDTE